MAFSVAAPLTVATILFALFSIYILAPGMVFGDEIEFYNCDSDDFDNKLSKVTSLAISGCNEDDCSIPSGSKVNATVEFEPEEDYEELVLNLDANLEMGTTHLLQNEQLCGTDMYCPVVAGNSTLLVRNNFEINIPFFVPESMMKNLEMNATLTEKDSKKVAACVLFYITVKRV